MTKKDIHKRLETYSIGEKIDIDGRIVLLDRNGIMNYQKSINVDDSNNKVKSVDEANDGIVLEDIDTYKSNWTSIKEKWKAAKIFIKNSLDNANVIANMNETDDNNNYYMNNVTNNNYYSIRWNYKWEILDNEWFIRKHEEIYKPDSSTVKIILLIIDPQNDFHDDPLIDEKQRGYTGTLAINGATNDSIRITKMIMDNIDDIDEIYVTLDTHLKRHIAHACFWESWIEKKENGEEIIHPQPYDIITNDDIKKGIYKPKCNGTLEEKNQLKAHCETYTKELENKGKFQLCIWPEHCLIGTKGHAIIPTLNNALNTWCRKTAKSINFIHKTQNTLTEMYSALEAEVPIPNDPTTMLNKDFLNRLKIADQLLICGQAKSHCVNFTTRDILKHWTKDKQRICILEDGCSNVKGFEAQGNKFITDMEKEGLTICKTIEAFDLFIGKNLKSNKII